MVFNNGNILQKLANGVFIKLKNKANPADIQQWQQLTYYWVPALRNQKMKEA